MSDIHQLFDQGNYTEALAQLRLALAQKEQPGDDRFDLLQLKGETLLRTKSDTGAADAFGAAAKIANSDEQGSPARAMEYLLRRTHDEMYTPKSQIHSGATTQPAISVIEKESRKQAFAALLTDELAAKSHQIDSAKKATTLPPILEIAPTVGSLQDVERAATGSTEKTGDMAKDVGDRARELITTAINKMTTELNGLGRKAVPNSGHVKGTGNNERHPLTPAEIQEVSTISSTCDQIVAACTQLGKSMGTGGGDFAAPSKSAEDLKKRADETLKKSAPKTGTGN